MSSTSQSLESHGGFAANKDMHNISSNTDWYNPPITLSTIPALALPMLEDATGLKGENLVEHINACREKAWSVNPYPCIGMWLFLELCIAGEPLYHDILERLTDTSRNDRILDFACGLGQELRKLSFDGVDAKKLYGVDLSQGLIDAGFDLFCDRDTDVTFATGDIWADDPLGKLGAGNKTFDIAHCSAFLHMFSFDQQVRIAKTLAGFLSMKPDTLIFGWTTGTVKAGEYDVGKNGEGRAYTHNVESFQKLWEEVGKQTQTKWNVEAMLQKAPGIFDRIANTEAWGQGFPERMFLKFSVQKA